MTVGTFLGKAEALRAMGFRALFSPDIKLLKNEGAAAGKAAAQQLRAEAATARAAGRKPSACLPAKMTVSSNDVMGHFASIPPAQRGMSVTEGMKGMLAKKYPCP